VRIEAREGDRDVGVLRGELRDDVVRHLRPPRESFVDGETTHAMRRER
jgi:hypothetical protein